MPAYLGRGWTGVFTRPLLVAALLGNLAGALLGGGCPNQPPADSPVDAVIGWSVLTGPAPLTVTFSAAASSSENPGALTYRWDFDDGATATEPQVTHVFTQPGRYIVRLTVTDATDASVSTTVDVRAAGAGAVAVITANPTSGPAPLTVQFSGTASQVPDDEILFYRWNFGDGATSTAASPLHIYRFAGDYTATLEIETGGGLKSTATTTIAVGTRGGSLQFSGSNLANLPLGATLDFNAVTLEAWVSADSEGGTFASLGAAAMTLELRPATNTIRVQVNGVSAEAAATSLAGRWRHVAAVYNSANGAAALYLDGAPIAGLNTTNPVSADRIVIGNGFRGKIADVRVWGAARSATEVAAAYNRRLAGTEATLVGYWPIYDGTGQQLQNLARLAAAGTLGNSTNVEPADPAWSPDGPPI
ncbi:MAG: PKD domain-containing protein [Planctomycetota bacterium]